jgi:hypothetical protein
MHDEMLLMMMMSAEHLVVVQFVRTSGGLWGTRAGNAISSGAFATAKLLPFKLPSGKLGYAHSPSLSPLLKLGNWESNFQCH